MNLIDCQVEQRDVALAIDVAGVQLSLHHIKPALAVRVLVKQQRIAFQFEARDVNLVMGPTSKGAAIPFRVFLDGTQPTDAVGTDVQSDGSGTLTDQRTYQLIRQPGQIKERRFEVEFLEPGAEAYCFTFG